MNYTYQIPLDSFGKPSTTVILRSDGAHIPMNESNSDYQAYLNKDKPQIPLVIDEASAE